MLLLQSIIAVHSSDQQSYAINSDTENVNINFKVSVLQKLKEMIVQCTSIFYFY